MSRWDSAPFSTFTIDSNNLSNGNLPDQNHSGENKMEVSTIDTRIPPPSLIHSPPPVRKTSNLKHFFRTLSNLSMSKRAGRGLSDAQTIGGDDLQVNVNRPVYNLDHFDAENGYIGNAGRQTFKEKAKAKAKKACTCSRGRLMSIILGMFPFLTWMREYNWKFDWINDLTAGVTVGIMSIPQGMSYAGLVGVPPIYGLYTNLVPTIVYFFLGTARHAAIGTVAVISLMMGTIRFKNMPDSKSHFSPGCSSLLGNMTNVTSDDDVPASIFDSSDCYTSWQLAHATSLLAGILLIIMGFMRLGFISYYLSDYLVGGFTSGAAIHVFTSQIDYVFGTHLPRHSGPGTIVLTYIELFKHIHETNKATIIIACVCIVCLLIVKEILSPMFQKRCRVPLPGELMVVIIGTIASLFGHFKQDYNVDIVSKIPSGFPSPVAPRVDLMSKIFVDALVLAIVNYSLSVSLAKLYAKRNNYKIDPYQEFFAYGCINISGSIFRAFPSGQSVARSIVYESSGAKSQFAGVIGTIMVVITILWLAPFLEALPKACLGAIIVVACVEMLQQLKQLKPLFKASKIDFSIYIVTFAAVVILDVTEGLAVSVLYAFFTVIYRTQCVKIRTMGRVADTDLYGEIDRYDKAEQVPGIKVFHFNAPLYYANVENFKPSLYKRCNVDPALIKAQQQQNAATEKRRGSGGGDANAVVKQRGACGGVVNKVFEESKGETPTAPSPKFVIVDCSGFSYIDLMGVNVLKQVYEELKDVGITVCYAACNTTVRKTMELAKFYDAVPKTNLFVSVHDGVTDSAKKIRVQQNNNTEQMADPALALQSMNGGRNENVEGDWVDDDSGNGPDRHPSPPPAADQPISFTAARKFSRT